MESVLPATGEWSLPALNSPHEPSMIIHDNLSPAQLRRAVAEWPWWAPGAQPEPAHCSNSVWVRYWVYSVPALPGTSLWLRNIAAAAAKVPLVNDLCFWEAQGEVLGWKTAFCWLQGSLGYHYTQLIHVVWMYLSGSSEVWLSRNTSFFFFNRLKLAWISSSNWNNIPQGLHFSMAVWLKLVLPFPLPGEPLCAPWLMKWNEHCDQYLWCRSGHLHFLQPFLHWKAGVEVPDLSCSWLNCSRRRRLQRLLLVVFLLGSHATCTDLLILFIDWQN